MPVSADRTNDAAPNPLGDRPSSGRDRFLPFLNLLGLKLEHAEAGVARISLDLRAELCNNHGAGHGGVIMTLLDSAMSNAALSKLDYSREVVTIDMQIAFMRAATGLLVATGRATGGGKSVCFCEAELADQHGQVLAKAMGTFRYRQPGHAHPPEETRDAR